MPMPDMPNQRPEWWPPNEPWPPRNWRRGRPFFWRAAIFGLVVFIFVSGFCTLAFWSAVFFSDWRDRPPTINDRRPSFSFPGPTRMPLPAILLWAGGAVVVIALVTRGFRRIVAPVSDIMQAATQVEQGDYSVRVRVRGNGDTRALARAFNAMTARLETNAEQRKRLLADVTHELRTPLTVIQGNLEGVLDGVYPRDDAHLLPILDETRVMSRLIDDLRTLSLAEAGVLKLQRENVHIGGLIEDVIVSFTAPATRAGVRLLTNVTGALPQLDVDATRIREVLANLVSNALRHTQDGGEIRVSAAPVEDAVQILVKDTGSGIAPADLPHIFDRFYKAADSGGSGLGLAIAKGLVEAHGGHIEAESVLGSGTEIRFTLPTR